MTEERATALLAAAQASEATTELLRFAREGEQNDCFAFDGEVMEKLAEALKLAIDLELPRMAVAQQRFSGDEDGREAVTMLHAALVSFIEGWC